MCLFFNSMKKPTSKIPFLFFLDLGIQLLPLTELGASASCSLYPGSGFMGKPHRPLSSLARSLAAVFYRHQQLQLLVNQEMALTTRNWASFSDSYQNQQKCCLHVLFPDTSSETANEDACGSCPGEAMELSSKKKLHALSLAEKIQVLELLDESKMSQSEVARRFQVSQPQISRICKNKEKLLADWCSGTANRERKRKRESKYSGIDEALLCWYHIARAKAWDVTGPMLLHKAKELADILGQDFVPSIGWLVRWKRRNNVGFGARHVLAPPFPPEPPPPGLMSQTQLPLSLKDFSPEDVFGCAEVPLLYRAVPGRVGAGDQVQVLLCANSRGTEKRRVLVSGLQAAPRCFFGVSSEALPASYHPDVGIPWSEWLAQFDQDMGRQGRQVALLLAAQVVEELAGRPGLCHVTLLPLSTTSTTPSLPSSVIRAFKAHYRHRLLGKLAAVQSKRAGTSLAEAGAGLTVLDTLHMAAAAWAKVPPQFIVSSFLQEGLAPCKMPLSSDKASEMPPVPGGLSFEEFSRFVDLEGEEPASGVCKEETGTEDEEGAGEGGYEPLPTRADALRALGTLRRWFECNGTSPELFEKFYACEEEVERLCCL